MMINELKGFIKGFCILCNKDLLIWNPDTKNANSLTCEECRTLIENGILIIIKTVELTNPEVKTTVFIKNFSNIQGISHNEAHNAISKSMLFTAQFIAEFFKTMLNPKGITIQGNSAIPIPVDTLIDKGNITINLGYYIKLRFS